LAAQLMAGLDGIKNKIHPGDPLDKNLYELPPEELANVPSAPDSLKGAAEALAADHDFLLAGGVFTKDLIDTLSSFASRITTSFASARIRSSSSSITIAKQPFAKFSGGRLHDGRSTTPTKRRLRKRGGVFLASEFWRTESVEYDGPPGA
jgi:hypothetical protein